MASLVPSRVKNTGIDLIIGAVLIGGAVLGVGFLNKRYNILGKFVSGSTNIGKAIGGAVGGGISAIPIGIGQGVSGQLVGTGPTNLTRQSLGLEPDTATCTHIPFTNIPIPGSQCSVAGTQTTPNINPKGGSLPQTSPQSDPGNGFATQQTFPNLLPSASGEPSFDRSKPIAGASQFTKFTDLNNTSFGLPSALGGANSPLNILPAYTQPKTNPLAISQSIIDRSNALRSQLGLPSLQQAAGVPIVSTNKAGLVQPKTTVGVSQNTMSQGVLTARNIPSTIFQNPGNL